MRARLLLPLLILALAWTQELIDQLLFAGQWNLPMGLDQPWWGAVTAPFSHAGFGHLISNSLAFLPLSWLVLSRGMRDYLSVWLSVLLINIPVALFWPARSHGLSVLLTYSSSPPESDVQFGLPSVDINSVGSVATTILGGESG